MKRQRERTRRERSTFDCTGQPPPQKLILQPRIAVMTYADGRFFPKKRYKIRTARHRAIQSAQSGPSQN